MSRRALVLWVTAAVAVAAAVVVAVTQRGNASPKHDAVAAYIEQVDGTQRQMRQRVARTLKAYRAFSSKRGITAAQTKDLLDGERTLAALRRRIDAVPAPEPAAQLRKLLLELVDAEVGVSHEVAELVVFAPRYDAVLGSSRKAGEDLSHSLESITPPKPETLHGTRAQVEAAQAAFAEASSAAAGAQAAAIDAYLGRIAEVERRLRTLDPPPALEPAWRAQIAAFSGTRRVGTRLVQELRKPDRADVATLGRRFTIAARAAGSVRAQKAQIAAIKAYNRRVRSIGELQTRVQDELRRLQRVSG